ncbi:TetR/AcrR family transcriptional regulator [Seonamhaeicola marinus]|uniref:TetR/AcrR family transcriptional regulator n=1 Tax=Seonamhaeicola marinus TaxID=1912246 RepID=A0A5D0HX42_9FLAO|nr:TetR/AcrR family transcriptional regulator [Seonamhaeicola marinus]TYA74707.1 TetR/AcrR family transcriptional regulator [Seonamhaeicola marinus]
MKRTKVIILETALKLFNEEGLPRVTLRTIASTMGISQGNLNYHFKKRDEIIEGLYFQLVAKIDETIKRNTTTNNPLEGFLNISKSMLFCFYEYRFFLLDFVQIMRENSKIKAHYAMLLKLREQQFSELLEQLKSEKIIREEQLQNEYRNLYKRGHILSDFWIAAAQTQGNEITSESIDSHFQIMAQGFYPYLTEKGKEVYFHFIKT